MRAGEKTKSDLDWLTKFQEAAFQPLGLDFPGIRGILHTGRPFVNPILAIPDPLTR